MYKYYYQVNQKKERKQARFPILFEHEKRESEDGEKGKLFYWQGYLKCSKKKEETQQVSFFFEREKRQIVRHAIDRIRV